MALTNKISAVLPDESVTAAQTAIGAIESALPFLIDLTPEEVSALPRFGDKSVAFVNNALVLAQQNDQFLPRSFSVDEFKKDVDLYNQLYKIIQPLRGLLNKLEHTFMLTGAEAYSSGLLVYSTAKTSKDMLGGLGADVDELGKRFVQKTAAVEEQPST